MTGRPSTYSQEIADEVCRRLAGGESLRAICRDEGIPDESTVRLWALDDREGFAAQYARAREVQFLAIADELLEIADDGRNDWMQRKGKDKRGGWELMDRESARSGGMSERNGRQYQAWSNSLTRVLNQIGFKAVADKPPALQDYLAARSAQAPAAA